VCLSLALFYYSSLTCGSLVSINFREIAREIKELMFLKKCFYEIYDFLQKKFCKYVCAVSTLIILNNLKRYVEFTSRIKGGTVF